MAKCLECFHWKPCFNGKEWDAVVGSPCEYFLDVDAAQAVHGQWNRYGRNLGYCSECGEVVVIRYRYCPNCGARMDGDPDAC